jgi:hypothetical protein
MCPDDESPDESSVSTDVRTQPPKLRSLGPVLAQYRRYVMHSESWLGGVPEDERQELGEALARVFRGFVANVTECLRGLLATDGWVVDEKHPGYLVRRFDDTDVRVPFNLAVGLPRQAAMQELLAYAREIRAPRHTLICLSGSAVTWRPGIEPADLDFCEYVAVATPEHNGVLGDILRHAIGITTESLAWITVKPFRSQGPTATRTSPPEECERAFDAASLAGRGKCSFVAITRSWGTLEVTKVVLMRPRWTESYAQQELPVDGAGWVPHELVNAASIRTYATWLREAIEQEIEKHDDAIKAARRMVALARLMFWDDLAERAQKFLKSRGMRGVVNSRYRLLQSLQSQSVPELQPFELQLRTTLERLLYGGRKPDVAPDPPTDWSVPLQPFLNSAQDRADVRRLRQTFERRFASLAEDQAH